MCPSLPTKTPYDNMNSTSPELVVYERRWRVTCNLSLSVTDRYVDKPHVPMYLEGNELSQDACTCNMHIV